ncbi:phage tail protein, partial [Serratia marcescens]|uniref:phage tail fiber protein n=2 Tax=Serratia TaxID=613 RepID=UPI002794C7D1
AWYAVPRDAMNTITAQLAAETAKALRGLNLDKNNWQQVFSGTGNITVTLPDGSTYTGPAWNSFTSALNLKADKTELDKKADKSSLGSLASKNSITRSELNNELVRNLFASGARSKNDGGAGVWTFDNTPWGFDTQYGIAIQVNNRTDTSNAAGDGIWQHYLALGTNGEILYVLNINGQYAAHKMWSTKNTTVDGNGFLKKASPIVKLFRDGTCELNDESQGVTTERVSEGVYRVSGTLGFNADAQWGGPDGGIEVPLDRNKQPLIWVDYEVEPTGDLLIKTYHRTHTAAPPFARNDVQGYDEGMPIDIPTGRWIDLRVEMPVKKEINK